MNKQVGFQMELDQFNIELEVTASVTPFIRGTRAHKFDQPDPDDGGEVEDLYVGIIIGGVSIDITDKLPPKVRARILEQCLEECES
jgi:hypothetical protein